MKLCITHRTRRFLLLTVFIVGIQGVCFTVLNGDETKGSKNLMEEQKVYRDPFSLPTSVRFEKKEEVKRSEFDVAYMEWPEGEVASSVKGVFRSGENTMANINGKWVKEGDMVGEERVMEIGNDVVALMGDEKVKRELPLPGAGANLKVVKKVKPKAKEEK